MALRSTAHFAVLDLSQLGHELKMIPFLGAGIVGPSSLQSNSVLELLAAFKAVRAT